MYLRAFSKSKLRAASFISFSTFSINNFLSLLDNLSFFLLVSFTDVDTTSLISLIIVPVAWIILFLGKPPYYILAFQVVVNVMIYAYRLYFAWIKVDFPIVQYLISIVLRSLLLTMIIVPLPLLSLQFMKEGDCWIFSGLLSFFVSLIVFYFGGFSKEYRKGLLRSFRSKLLR